MSKEKEFDCVKMKREAARKLHEELEGKSLEERLAFWREIHEQMEATKQDSDKRSRSD